MHNFIGYWLSCFVDRRFSRSSIVSSCCHSQSIAVNRNVATATRNMATTPDRSHAEYCVAVHTFRTRSCSSRSYYLADMPAVVSSRTAALIHNSYQCCNLAAVHNCCTTIRVLLVTTTNCFPNSVDRSIITKFGPLIVKAKCRMWVLRLAGAIYR